MNTFQNIFYFTLIVFLNILFCFEIRAQDIRNSLNIISPGNSNYIHQNTENNNTWISVQTPSLPYYITDVFFIDSLYGWASHAGVGIGIVKTTNSGYSWDSVQFSPVGDFLASIYFLDRLTGWTCGSAGKLGRLQTVDLIG
ncbi:MAG: hypothetical protein IPM38_10690 [Ignavibacteria bacterium]|nr:hypothetical protein [Ignavibacteria bacterium]